MFKVILIKHVWNSDSPETSTKWALFSRIVELPFVPIPGLGVQLPMQRVWRLRSADWDVEEQLFRCCADDQYMEGIDDYFEDWLEELREAGWKLEGPFPKS